MESKIFNLINRMFKKDHIPSLFEFFYVCPSRERGNPAIQPENFKPDGYNRQVLFVILFLLFYPITSGSQLEIRNRMKNCWQAFSRQAIEVSSYVKKIRESSSKDDMIEVWKKVPAKMQSSVAQQIFTEEGNTEIKQNLALVIGEVETDISPTNVGSSPAVPLVQNKPKRHKLHRLLAKILLETEEFETEEFNLIKQNIVESIKRMSPKDSKIQKSLVDSLESFNGERQTDIRNEIYSFFESISKDITTTTVRKLASKVGRRIAPEEKKHIIEILRKRTPKDTLTITIQYLAEGLNDSSPEVRIATIKALEKILILEGFLKKVYDNSIHPFVYSIKSLFDVRNTIQNRRFYILEALLHIARYDSDPFVQKSAIKAIVKINNEYAIGLAMVTDILIEIISSNSASDVKEEALSALEETLKGPNRRFYHLSAHIVKERKLITIKQLTKALYDKNQDIRKAARKAFRVLQGKGKTALQSYYKIQDSKAKELQKRIADYQITGKGLTYDNPNSQPANRVPPPFESWFEVEVFLKIHEKGYVVLPQYVYASSSEAKEYRIDLVIVSSDKKVISLESMLAVECDGYYHNTSKQRKEDEEKRRVLEDERWNIWNVKHSKEKNPLLPYPPFYSSYPNWKGRKINPGALDELWEELKRKEIKPVNDTPPGSV